MITIKDNKFFHIITINGDKLEPINEINSVTIEPSLVKGIIKCGYGYTIQDNMFIQNQNGEWICQNIYWEQNKDKKFWQFWKDDKVCSQILMGRHK